MSRRNPSRAAHKRRTRTPLAELGVNAHGDIVDFEEKHEDPPNLNLLSSLASAQVIAPDANAADFNPADPDEATEDEATTEEKEDQPAPPRKKRGKYNPRLNIKQREEVMEMWIDGKDAPKIIAHFARKGVALKSSTIDSMLRRLREEDRIALKTTHIVRQPKYTYEAYKAMADIQLAHAQWTYDQVAAEWKVWWSRQNNGRTDGPTPSHYTIHKAFKLFDVTTKNLEWVPQVQNDEHHINWRQDYCKAAITWDRGNLIFIDETGFNMHLHRKRGRSLKGMRAHAIEKNSPGIRINVCAAVSAVQGLVKYKCILTTYNTDEFATFMQELLDTPLLQNQSCMLIMDNVNWHHRDEVHDVLRAGRVQHRIKRLPSYSPHLNPIEYAFAIWKAAIKRVDQTITNLSLQRQIDDAAPLISDRLISRCLDHVYRYYVACIQRLPLDKFDPRLDDGGAVIMHTDETEEKTEEKEETE